LQAGPDLETPQLVLVRKAHAVVRDVERVPDGLFLGNGITGHQEKHNRKKIFFGDAARVKKWFHKRDLRIKDFRVNSPVNIIILVRILQMHKINPLIRTLLILFAGKGG